MAIPVVANTNNTLGSTAATNKVCNLPASIASGNLLLLILRSAGADTHSTPSGWTQLLLNDVSDASDDTVSFWYKKASGSEGGSVTVNGTTSLKFASISWRITGHADPAVHAPEISATSNGLNTNPDPGNLAPAGGSQSYLWLWVGSWAGEQTSPPTGNPTNYGSNIVGADSGTAGVTTTNCRCATASRQLTASSENPPIWAISVSDSWLAFTVAIAPQRVDAVVGAFTLSGIATTLTRALHLTTVVGAFSLTGNAVTLLRSHAYSVTVVVGTFSLTGNAVGLLQGKEFSAIVGTFVLTGNALALKKAWEAALSVGTFVLTGSALVFQRTWEAAVTVGTFALTGNALALKKAWEAALSVGTFVLTGSSTAFQRTQRLLTAVTSFLLAGTDTGLIHGSGGPQNLVLSTVVGVFQLTGIVCRLVFNSPFLNRQSPASNPVNARGDVTKRARDVFRDYHPQGPGDEQLLVFDKNGKRIG